MPTLREIATAIGARGEGNLDLVIARPAEPATAGPNDLALAMQEKFAAGLAEGQARAALLWDGADWAALGLEGALFVARPRHAMAGITQRFDAGRALSDIHPTAIIDPSATLGAGAAIGPFVVIGPDVVIGDGARIHAHASIAAGTRIGRDLLLYDGVRLGHDLIIGDRFRAHSNTVVGSDGFSFVTPEAGAIDAVRGGMAVDKSYEEQAFARIHSLGGVRIGDDVEIGALTAIDRGTIADTVIGDGTKIDNLVQVGHNVQVGRTCLLCGGVGIGGSTVIGNRVVLGGQAGVADHVTVGDNVIAAGKSGISSNVPPNRAIMGNPAVKMETNVEMYRALRRLPRFFKRMADAEKTVSKD